MNRASLVRGRREEGRGPTRAWRGGLVVAVMLPCLLTIILTAHPGARAEETLFSDDFENTFPGTTYSVRDEDAGSGLDHWGQSTARSFSGSRSLWCAQVGTNGGAPNADLGVYDTFMLASFGFWIPALSPSSTANLTFMLWLEADWPYDVFRVLAGVSEVDMWFVSRPRNNTVGWTPVSVALPYSIRYLRFEFYSNSDTIFEGAYVDDIVVTGTPAPPPDTQSPEISHTPVAAAGPDRPIEVVATITDDVGVAGASVRYSVRGSTGLVWVSEPLTEQSPGRFAGAIPDQPAGVTYYYLLAWDAADNQVALPEARDSDPFAIAVGDTQGSPVEMPPWVVSVFVLTGLASAIGGAYIAVRRRKKQA